MKIIKLVKLNEQFFKENGNLVEALHGGATGDLASEKTRGYGVVTVRIENGMLFGIPLRSHITHRSSFITAGTKGLDYSKAVLIRNESHVSREAFHIPQEEFVKIADREFHIRERFEKYIKRYIKAVHAGDQNIIRDYRYSTLQNYHEDFNIPPPARL